MRGSQVGLSPYVSHPAAPPDGLIRVLPSSAHIHPEGPPVSALPAELPGSQVPRSFLRSPSRVVPPAPSLHKPTPVRTPPEAALTAGCPGSGGIFPYTAGSSEEGPPPG